MLTLLFLFALQVATPGEMACVGTIQEMRIPEDIYVAGVEEEGIATFATPGQMLYLNGPGASVLKAGATLKVIRPAGNILDPSTKQKLGGYYKDIGVITVEAVDQEGAAARVLSVCEGVAKGDLVVPNAPRPSIEFNGPLSTVSTELPSGLVTSILSAKHDARQLAAGSICFIPVGKRDGVKAGDRFIIYRRQQRFNRADMRNTEVSANSTYSSMRGGLRGYKLNPMLKNRTIPPRILGDLVIIEAGEGISTAKIINSLYEIGYGDRVVKR